MCSLPRLRVRGSPPWEAPVQGRAALAGAGPLQVASAFPACVRGPLITTQEGCGQMPEASVSHGTDAVWSLLGSHQPKSTQPRPRRVACGPGHAQCGWERAHGGSLLRGEGGGRGRQAAGHAWRALLGVGRGSAVGWSSRRTRLPAWRPCWFPENHHKHSGFKHPHL